MALITGETDLWRSYNHSRRAGGPGDPLMRPTWLVAVPHLTVDPSNVHCVGYLGEYDFVFGRWWHFCKLIILHHVAKKASSYLVR